MRKQLTATPCARLDLARRGVDGTGQLERAYVGRPCRARDVRPGLGECERDRAPHAAARARHQGRRATQLHRGRIARPGGAPKAPPRWLATPERDPRLRCGEAGAPSPLRFGAAEPDASIGRCWRRLIGAPTAPPPPRAAVPRPAAAKRRCPRAPGPPAGEGAPARE